MKISGIYKIINKINDKYYIGSSNNIYKRFNQHKLNLNKNIHKNSHLQWSWNKYGNNNFNFVIIEEIPQENLLLVEQKYLDIAKIEKNKCYNTSFIAGRIEMTDEIRKKLSKSHIGLLRGINHPLYGKHLSENTKNKLRFINLGKKRSLESIEKSRMGFIGKYIGEKSWRYGKHHSEETKRKISLAGTKRKHSNETKEKMRLSKLGKKYSKESIRKSAESRSKLWRFINPDGIILEFKNLSFFCKDKSLDKSAMSNVFYGKSSHHKGWKSVSSLK